MARRHGRARCPFKKYKGIELRFIQDTAYLTWMATTDFVHRPEMAFLLESLRAELEHRGLNGDEVYEHEPAPQLPVPQSGELFPEKAAGEAPRRLYRL